MIRYSSTTLETIRFNTQPSNRDRVDLLASGWQPHIYEPRLYLLKREIKCMHFSTVQGFVLPPEADWHDPAVRAALCG